MTSPYLTPFSARRRHSPGSEQFITYSMLQSEMINFLLLISPSLNNADGRRTSLLKMSLKISNWRKFSKIEALVCDLSDCVFSYSNHPLAIFCKNCLGSKLKGAKYTYKLCQFVIKNSTTTSAQKVAIFKFHIQASITQKSSGKVTAQFFLSTGNFCQFDLKNCLNSANFDATAL